MTTKRSSIKPARRKTPPVPLSQGGRERSSLNPAKLAEDAAWLLRNSQWKGDDRHEDTPSS